MSSQLQIRLFGSLEIRLNDATLTNFMSNKAPALLAYLALNPRPQQRDALATLLWSEMSDADAKNNLRQVLTNLRKLVDPHLVVTRDTIGFNQEAPYSLDVENFERHLQMSRKQEEAERAEALRQATILYAGEFLAGFFLRDAPEFEEWMLAYRARLRELALHALHELTQLEMAQGHFAQAIDSSSRSLTIDPWREEAHRQLMLALARSGQRSAALSQYKLCQRTLLNELGVEPSNETQKLYERIRAAGESIAHHLPPQATSFVGRWRELQAIERELLNPACRMLTLVGVGGIGKTRLALQAAERLLQIGAFLNGVYFVPLAALDSPALIVPAIAEACSFKFAGNREPAAQLIDFLRNQEVLLVLDNFEVLLEGASGLGQLLERVPALKLLVTSRERLNLRWERVLPIAEMDEATAIQLFLARAQTAQPNFQVNGAEKESVQRICSLTGQLPLAIELAAAWVRALSCSEIAEEISQSLDFLTTDQRDGVVRHGSLRALFHSSWQFLRHEEQRLLARLAIFSNGFTRNSAVEIAEATTRSLAALMDKSLLQRDSNARYFMHPVVQQYASEKLATDAASQRNTAQRHCDYFANFLEKHGAALKDGRLLATSVEIESELDNVRTAWHWAVEQGSAPQLSKMIDAVYSFWIHRGYYQEGFSLFANAVVALQSYPLALGAALARQAYFAYFLDRFDLAIDLARQSRTLLETSPQKGGADCALAYCVEGLSFWRSGKLAEAQQAMHTSMEFSLAVQDLFSLGRAYRYQGILVHDEGQHEEALKWYKLAEEVDRRQGHPYAISSSLNNMGNLYFGVGDYDLAKDYWEQSLVLTQQLGDRRSEAAVLSNLGLIEKVAGRLEAARELTACALSIRRGVGDLSGATVTLANLGDIANQQGDYHQALSYHRESLTLCRQLNTTFTVSNALLGMGYAFLGLGELSEARFHFKQAFDASLATHYLPEAMGAITGLAQVEYRLDAIEEAGKLIQLVLAHPSTYRETRDEAESLLHLIEQTCNANNLQLDLTPYTLEFVMARCNLTGTS